MIEFNKEIISNCKIKTNLLDALENLKIIKKAYRLSDYDYLS